MQLTDELIEGVVVVVIGPVHPEGQGFCEVRVVFVKSSNEKLR